MKWTFLKLLVGPCGLIKVLVLNYITSASGSKRTYNYKKIERPDGDWWLNTSGNWP